MSNFKNKILKFIPLFRRYIELDKVEKELRPKVKSGIKRIMANGNKAKKKKITDSIYEQLENCEAKA